MILQMPWIIPKYPAIICPGVIINTDNVKSQRQDKQKKSGQQQQTKKS
jgi:hypothetical protein